MSETTSGVTFLTVAYHRPEPLDRQLHSAHVPGIELLVVNAESDPEIRRVAERHGARVIDLAGNRGYAAGINAGVQVAKTAVVIFANDDVVCPPETLFGLARAIGADEVDVAVPLVIGPSGGGVRTIQAVPSLGSLLLEWALLPDTPIRSLRHLLVVQKWREPNVAERIEAASAVAVAVRRGLLLECPIPEAYFLYWEESEWFALLARRGARVEFRPELIVVHRGGREVTSAAKSALIARNAVRCIRRLHGRRAARAAYVITLAWQLRLLVTGVGRVLLRKSGSAPGLLTARLAGLRAAVASWGETR